MIGVEDKHHPEGPQGVLDRVPPRLGYVRRWINASEYDHFYTNGWRRVEEKDGLGFKTSVRDPIDAIGNQMFLVEIEGSEVTVVVERAKRTVFPATGAYKDFAYRFMGGKRNEQIAENLRPKRDGRGRVIEGVETEEKTLHIPKEALIKRKS